MICFTPVGACELFAAFHEGEVLAALMVFRSRKTCLVLIWSLWKSETSPDAHIPVAMGSNALGKKSGMPALRLMGSPDQDEDFLEEHFNEHHDGLWGVYRFKRGFGGKLIRLPGAFDRVYQKFPYRLYKLYIRLFRQGASELVNPTS